MKQFDTLAKLLDFIHNLEECGMPIPPELYEQKARLEERERIERWAREFPRKEFPGRKRLGINNLKD